MYNQGSVPEEMHAHAVALLRRAGEVALRYFRAPLAIEDKGVRTFDPVTAADREVETLLREGLLGRYPDHGVLGEEHGMHAAQAPFEWIIDPIDGTRAFITGVPLWGILLGLRAHGELALGFMYQPYLDELYGGDGASAWLERGGERRPVRAAATRSLADASLYTTHPEVFATAADAAAYQDLARRCRMHRYGGDCYSYCLLAAGSVDLVLESGLAAYDILPLIPILEGAGAVVSDWRGEALRAGGQVLAAATPQLHVAALEVLARTGGV